jgi:hypothetical protein
MELFANINHCVYVDMVPIYSLYMNKAFFIEVLDYQRDK